MNSEEHTSIEDLNRNIQTLSKKIDKLEYTVTDDQIKVNTHPIMFVVILVGFFITMDFWTAAAHSTIINLHPKGYLQYWEYVILAVVALLLLLWLSNKSGIKIRMLGE
jgi:hypothetical protein